jgi:hypothetical protein
VLLYRQSQAQLFGDLLRSRPGPWHKFCEHQLYARLIAPICNKIKFLHSNHKPKLGALKKWCIKLIVHDDSHTSHRFGSDCLTPFYESPKNAMVTGNPRGDQIVD